MATTSLLHKAAESGDVDQVRELLQHGKYDVNCTNSDKETPLHYAAFSGHLAVVEVLVSEFGADLTLKNDDKYTAVMLAAALGHSDVVSFLLHKFLNSLSPGSANEFNIEGKYAMTLLPCACQVGDVSQVRSLIREHKANVNAKAFNDDLPIHMAARYGNAETCFVLIKEFECDPTAIGGNGMTLLHCACQGGSVDLVRTLIREHNADVNARDSDDDLPIHTAARHGNAETCFVLIKEFECDPTAIGRDGMTLLHCACQGGSVELVRTLIREHKADVNARDSDDDLPIHTAARHGNAETCFVLIKEFECDLTAIGRKEMTLLHCACQGGDVSLVRSLILEHKADVNAKDADNDLPIHIAARHDKSDATLALISEFGCNPSAVGWQEMTLLHCACQGGSVDLARTLIREHNADVNARDSDDDLPIHTAARHSNAETCFVLIKEFECDPTAIGGDGMTLLHCACQGGSVDLVRTLIREHNADVNARDSDDDLPIHTAARHSNAETCFVLIKEFECDPTAIGGDGMTLLHCACQGGSVDLVKTLIREHKASINDEDANGDLPIHTAARHGNGEATLVLIEEFGCYPSVVGGAKMPLLHCACQGGNTGLVRALVNSYNLDVNVLGSSSKDVTPVAVAAKHGNVALVQLLINELHCDTSILGEKGMSLLHYACQGNNVDLLQTLIMEHKFSVNVCDNNSNTPLHVAVAKGKNELALYLMTEFECSPKVVNRDGLSILHIACEEDNFDLIQSLIPDYDCDINAKDRYGRTPISCISCSDQGCKIALILMQHGCEPGSHSQYLLNSACRHGHIDLVCMLAGKCDFDSNELVSIATSHGHEEVAVWLVDNFGFQQNSESLMSVFDMAIIKDQARFIRTLLKYASPLEKNEDGTTPLHLASEKGKLDCVKALLDANAPILIRDRNGQTPLDVARGASKTFMELNAGKLVDYNDFLALAVEEHSEPCGITRVFVLGNHGAGKSSFIQTLKKDKFPAFLCKVSEQEVPPHTAGIIPSIHNSRLCGRMVIYDFAGDANYYSSHAAIFEKFASLSKGVNIFVVVVDLRDDNAAIESTTHYWLSFIQHQKFVGKPIYAVIGSHIDYFANDEQSIREKNQVLQRSCTSIRHKILYSLLDCREPQSVQLYSFRAQASRWANHVHYDLSLKACVLLGLLKKDFDTTCHGEALVSRIKSLGLCLPDTVEGLYHILIELHELGLILLLGNRNACDIIFDIPKLTNDVHKLLFSDINQTCKLMQTKTGIICNDILKNVLPAHITTDHLVHLQYCQQITHAEIGAFLSVNHQDPSMSFLFFPALCSVDKSEVPWDEEAPDKTFTIGWLARCTGAYDYFPPRFHHVLLLRLVFDHVHKRRCTVWKEGVHWISEEGVDCMVEILCQSQRNTGVKVLTKSPKNWEENCVVVFNRIIHCVMEAKAEFCHSIKPQFFLLDTKSESEDNMFLLSDVRKALLASPRKHVIISVSGKGKMMCSKLQCMCKLTYWSSLFPMDFDTVMYLLKDIVKELYELGEGLGVPSGILEAIEVDFPTSVTRRKRELVRWWINSSPEPPSWWHLVQALKRTTHRRLAEEVANEHDSHISLQGKMLCPANQTLKPDEKFLRLFSAEVGPKWPSLAMSLGLSEEDVAELKGKEEISHEELAFMMMNMWASREDATYGMLCQTLKTISLFQHLN